MNEEGFGPALLDQSSPNDAYGGAQSTGGASGNRIIIRMETTILNNKTMSLETDNGKTRAN